MPTGSRGPRLTLWVRQRALDCWRPERVGAFGVGAGFGPGPGPESFGFGGAGSTMTFPTTIFSDVVVVLPIASMPVTVTVCSPGELYVWLTAAPEADWPSPKSHETVTPDQASDGSTDMATGCPTVAVAGIVRFRNSGATGS